MKLMKEPVLSECSKTWHDSWLYPVRNDKGLLSIKEEFEGKKMPSGECPDCGAMCYHKGEMNNG